MSKLTLSYNKNSEHVLLPYRDEKIVKSPSGNKIDYIGTVVLRNFREGENVAKFDVYFMKDRIVERNWINSGRTETRMREIWQEQLANAVNTARKFLNAALNSPEDMKPLYDCHTIVVFAEAGYFFVDEAGQKSLRCFNIVCHTGKQPTIQSHYPGCEYFSSHYKNRVVEYEDGIPNVPLERF